MFILVIIESELSNAPFLNNLLITIFMLLVHIHINSNLYTNI